MSSRNIAKNVGLKGKGRENGRRSKARLSGFLLMSAALAFAVTAWPQVSEEAYNGYLLYSPTGGKVTYLRDLEGAIVHSWSHTTSAGFSTILSKKGTLIRAAVSPAAGINGAGATGLLEAVGKEGNVVWSFTYKNENHNLHHYIDVMPNGHVLAAAWEVKPQDSALTRDINASGDVWPDHIIEVAPPDDADTTAHIVWEWHMWDHLVPAAQAAAFPRRFSTALRATGSTAGTPLSGDWPHINGMSYDSARDEIAFSSRAFNEFYVIDHGTTIAEAGDSVGGKKGHGGDLLYRWGAPANYGATGNQYFDVAHAVKFIPQGAPGAGNFVIINNRQSSRQTHCVEVAPPRDSTGAYVHVLDSAFGPDTAVTFFTASGYFHVTTGSAQRLPNGNTLCVESDNGMIREFNPGGTIVWQYSAVPTPSAFKYAPDHPGIVALLGGETSVRNGLLNARVRSDVHRVRSGVSVRGAEGARIEIFTLSGHRVFAGVVSSGDYVWREASRHETYFVRLLRDGKIESLRVPPLL